MNTVIFKTEEAIFKFDRKSVMECLENRKSSYNIQELDNLIKLLANQPEQTILSSAEHQYFGYIALELIASEGSVTCKNCGKRYRSNLLRPLKVGSEDTLTEVASTKKGVVKGLFRKKLKPPGMYGGKGYRCPRGDILIYMQTWTT